MKEDKEEDVYPALEKDSKHKGGEKMSKDEHDGPCLIIHGEDNGSLGIEVRDFHASNCSYSRTLTLTRTHAAHALPSLTMNTLTQQGRAHHAHYTLHAHG